MINNQPINHYKGKRKLKRIYSEYFLAHLLVYLSITHVSYYLNLFKQNCCKPKFTL